MRVAPIVGAVHTFKSPSRLQSLGNEMRSLDKKLPLVGMYAMKPLEFLQMRIAQAIDSLRHRKAHL
jgi:hypothetical protein